jgi:hypothetical protein
MQTAWPEWIAESGRSWKFCKPETTVNPLSLKIVQLKSKSPNWQLYKGKD